MNLMEKNSVDYLATHSTNFSWGDFMSNNSPGVSIQSVLHR